MRLSDAVIRFHKEEGAPSSAYGWYRRSAHETGHVALGTVKICAWKSGGTWQVGDLDLDRAIDAHRRERARIRKITEDLARGILYGSDGDTVHTLDGGYRRWEPFRLVWNNIEVGRRKSNGTWYCNRCNRPAQTRHEKPECHLCADWNGCGNDCTLSEVSCATCGVKRTTGLS